MKDSNGLNKQAMELAQYLGLDEKEIEETLRYLSLTSKDIEFIKRLGEAAKSQDTASLWDHFYAHLQGFEKSNRFLKDPVRLKQLKLTQNRHFLELLAGNYDLDFFLSRLKVGIQHDQVGIGYFLYSGAYGKYLDLVMDYVAKNLEPSAVLTTLKALSKAVLLDLVIEGYSYFAVREKRLVGAKKTMELLNRALNVIHEINALIVRATDLDKLLDNATRIIVETGGFALAWIGMVDPQTDLILPRAAHGLTDYLRGLKVSIDPSLPEGQGPTGTAAREKRPVVIQATDKDPRFLPWEETAQRFGLHSAIALPLVVAGEAKGTLNIYSTRHASFTESEIALFEEVAGDIAYAIDHMEKKAEVERLLFWDELTGLGNYNHFSTWLTSRLQTMNPDSNHLLVIALDIDHFGVINHALGTHKGDMVLKEIANRLKVFAGDSGTAARFGADEFGLALDIHNKIPLTVIEELRQLISQHPIRLDDNEVSVSASTGLTVYPDDGLQAGQLIERAKMSLSDAKKQGGNQISFYSHELFEKNLKKVEMKRELNEALENLEFVLFFQPKIDLATREIAGFEALIRWQHPQKGLVQPGEFIPFLEESGLIVKVGKWVMEEAIRHIKESQVCKDSRMLISFNVSPKQFEQPGFVQELIETVKASGVDPKRLQIEVTEGLLMKNTRETIEKLARIRDAGLDISIDDFGTGYSSLQYLKYIPASTLKIDYSFVKGLPDEKKDVEIVKTILLLAQGLGKKTVAEGVETREQLVFLAGLGVDEVQGFYFARPMPKGECIKWIEDYRPETYFWPKR